MRPVGLVLLAALLAGGTVAPALAGPQAGRFLHPADANKDEQISKAEWLASKEDAAGFRAADRNRDGAVSGPEFARWFMDKEGIAPLQTSARQPAGAVHRFVER